ncbi:MAG: cupin domain-containing protein [Luteitalea sp.]|nr:cupin domain-containing protein [Luteitalea sp.]
MSVRASRALLVALSAAFIADLLALQVAESRANSGFIYRRLDRVQAKPSDVSTVTCRYKPLFGEGDSEASLVKGLARFGELIVDAGGESARVQYPDEEQAYVVMSGEGVLRYGEDERSIAAADFLYLPPGVQHSVSNPGSRPLHIIVMGYHIPKGTELTIPAKLLIANTSMAKQQVLDNHPDSTRYRLLMGGTDSKRDVIAAGHVLTSLFIMDIEPGGTNDPHRHATEEEIYLVLDGKGDMVAGDDPNGLEARHPATAGDAYFIRPNVTVGFYADDSPGAGNGRILAVRSTYLPTR